MIGMIALLLAPGVAALAAVRRRRTRLVLFLSISGWAAASVVVMLGLLLQVALVGEGSLPPDNLAGRFPTEVQVVNRGESCGSGGCWRFYDLRAEPALPVSALAERVEEAVHPGCRRRTWVPDLREHCTDVDVVDGEVVVHTYLQGF